MIALPNALQCKRTTGLSPCCNDEATNASVDTRTVPNCIGWQSRVFKNQKSRLT